MKTVSFYLVTDTHYFENKLGAGGEAFQKNMETEQYFVKESHAIVTATFAKIIEDKETDIVIIPGDLVKNGEKESHNSFIKKLYSLKENGKKVFHLDHCNPVAKLATRVLETDESIDDIIKDNLTAWILDSENDKLNKKYKSERPNGWDKCYAEYGITLKHRDDIK